MINLAMKQYILSIILALIAFTVNAQSAEYTEKKNKKLSEKSPFEKIIDGELPAEMVLENDHVVAFVPLRKQAPIHFLIVPRKRISTMNDITSTDVEVMGQMMLAAKKLAAEYGIAETGYRLSINTNEDSGQSVFHIHLHLLGGMKLGPMVDQTYRDKRTKD